MKEQLSLANDFLQRTLMFQDKFLFETRTGDEKDDNNSLQRFGVLHLLQREIVEGSVADFQLRILPRFLSAEGVTHRNVGDYYCHLFRHLFVSQIKKMWKNKWLTWHTVSESQVTEKKAFTTENGNDNECS